MGARGFAVAYRRPDKHEDEEQGDRDPKAENNSPGCVHAIQTEPAEQELRGAYVDWGGARNPQALSR